MKFTHQTTPLSLSFSLIGVLVLLFALALPLTPPTLRAETSTIDVRFDYTNFPAREKADATSTVIAYGCPYSFAGVAIVPGTATTKSTFTGAATSGGSAFFSPGVAQGHWTGFSMLALEKCFNGSTEYGVVKMWGYTASGAYLMSSDWIHYGDAYNYTLTIDTVKIGFANGDGVKDATTRMTFFILHDVC